MRKEIKKTVYRILEQDSYARTDDNYLIMRVVQQLEPELAGTSFVNVMQGLKYKGISFEGITRARRKFLEEYPEFKDSEITLVREKEEEKYFMEYSKYIPRID